MDDKEIQAIASVNDALKDLSEEERFRVIQWVANKYVQNTSRLKVISPASHGEAPVMLEGEPGSNVLSDQQQAAYDTFAEMLDASGATKDTERFLVAAYWLQVKDALPTWKSFQVNKLLKDTGNQINGITTPVRTLSKAKPKLVVQISKNTTSKGRGAKVFKLTTEGIKKVERMLSRGE